jgi:peroxidase
LCRIYHNASDIDAWFASTRQCGCPSSCTAANYQKLAVLDLVTPNSFDNNYFKNLIQKKGSSLIWSSFI